MSLYDNDTNARVAKATFKNVKVSGDLLETDYTNITFSFSFASGEADYDYWHSKSTINAWVSAQFTW